jgi:hypothetical protein
MDHDVLSFTRGSLRGADSNSLWRLYDQAKEILQQSPSPQRRARADRALQCIGKELDRRGVTA